jgi:hypothetical protein
MCSPYFQCHGISIKTPNYAAFPSLWVYSLGVKKTAIPNPQNDKFKKALASVLSASPEQIRESRVLAKAEKPSPHKRYTYAPEEGQP